MNKFFRAELETRSFTFEAYGSTKKESIDTLIKCCKKHCKQYECSWVEFISPSISSEMFAKNNFAVYEIKIGAAYRDSDIMVKGSSSCKDKI